MKEYNSRRSETDCENSDSAGDCIPEALGVLGALDVVEEVDEADEEDVLEVSEDGISICCAMQNC